MPDTIDHTMVVWKADTKLPGIAVTQYRGHKVEVRPIGSFEWDVFIDNEHKIIGTYDLDITKSIGLETVDRMVENEKASQA